MMTNEIPRIPEPLPPRPDLKKQSLLFETVKSVAVGVVVGSAMTLALSQAAHFKGFKESFKVNGPSEFIAKHIAGAAKGWGILMGAVGLSSTSGRNDTKSEVRPYVERLEQELLAKSVAPDSTQR